MDPNQYSDDPKQSLLANKEKQNESDYEKDFAKGGCLSFCNLFKRNRARTPPTPTDALDQIPQPKIEDGKLVEDPNLKNPIIEVEWRGHKVKYIDFKSGEGKAVETMIGEEKPSQKVTLNYNFYDMNSPVRVGRNIKHAQPYKRSPKKLKLCYHIFGKGFEKGIEGMQEGGIRRIIVPHELTSSKHKDFEVKGDAIYDVELHKVGLSLACVVRGIFDDKNEDDITWTSLPISQPN